MYGDRAFLSFADLTGAKLQFSGFVRADLSNAILRDADFSGVNLGGADLTGADLTGANLNEAILIGANLTRVRGWSTVTLEGVRECDTATRPRPLSPAC